MAFGQPSNDKLLVAVYGENALVKVLGRGTFKVSSSLREFGVAAIGMNCVRIIFDMSACIGMDSTFMGTVAGLALRLREKTKDGEIALCRLSEKNMGLLKTLGLNRITSAYSEGLEPRELATILRSAGNFETLRQPGESDHKTTKTMLNAHEALVDMKPGNINEFRDVIDFLREDLNRNSES